MAEHIAAASPFERLGDVASWRALTLEIHHRNALHAAGLGAGGAHSLRLTELAEDVVASGYLDALVSCNPNALGDALAVLYYLAAQGRLGDDAARGWQRHAQRALAFCTELTAPDALLMKAYRGALGHGCDDPSPELSALAVIEPLWVFRHHANALQVDDFCKVVIAIAVAGWTHEGAAAHCIALLPALRDTLLAAAPGDEPLDVVRLICLPPTLVGRPSRALAVVTGNDPMLEPLRALAQHVNREFVTC